MADALWCSEAAKLPGPSETVHYVLDGGALRHRIPWTKGATYDQICEQYSAYVIKKYGKATVVFDGYSDTPSTKDCAHIRRSRGKIGVTVQFTSSMALQTKKEEFLSNEQNKQRFIILLSQRSEQSGCEIHQARGDADVLIVQTALKSATKQETVLVGDDTDLLVLLIHHAKNVIHTVYFKLKLNGRVRREIDARTSLQSGHFLEILSLTTSCSCMPSLDVIPRLVFTVWARNYQSQRLNVTVSLKIRQRFS